MHGFSWQLSPSTNQLSPFEVNSLHNQLSINRPPSTLPFLSHRAHRQTRSSSSRSSPLSINDDLDFSTGQPQGILPYTPTPSPKASPSERRRPLRSLPFPRPSLSSTSATPEELSPFLFPFHTPPSSRPNQPSTQASLPTYQLNSSTAPIPTSGELSVKKNLDLISTSTSPLP